MKKIFTYAIVLGLLCMTSVPAISIAQENIEESVIVVTAENQKLWTKGNTLEGEGLKEMEKSKKALINASTNTVKAMNKRDTADVQSNRAYT